ncbi:MAG: sulfatase [Actinomycetota bacterium]
MRSSARFSYIALALVTATVVAVLALPAPGPVGAGELPVSPPNVVLVVMDDLRHEALTPQTMPTVHSEIYDKGIGFSNAFVVNPLCCPSRATILTGKYSHTTGVYSNGGAFGGFSAFDDSSTIATWLHDAGYRTALIGKYLNQYEGPYVPPGWDRWLAFQRADYFNYSLVDDGVLTAFGDAEQDYATDVLAAQAASFIRGTDAEQSLFLTFTPYAPHGPATPAPRHATAFSDLTDWRPPSYNEDRIADKPAYIRARSRLRGATRAAMDEFRRNQHRSLLAADEGVDRILTALEDTGRLSNTLVVFLSDNGILWGEHRWDRKVVPYEESIRVPMAIRYDPITAADTVQDRFVLNVDLAPTIAEVAGTAAPGVEGSSLVPLLAGTDPTWREEFLIEHAAFGIVNKEVPAYCAIRDPRYLYSVYETGELELYDLHRDPSELRNVVNRSRYADEVDSLHQRLVQLCDPVPPGFAFPA